MSTFNPIGAYLQKKMNVRVLLAIGGSIGIGGVFIASFVKTFQVFIFFYAVCFATGIGLNYFTPLICGWEWLPHRRGLVSGIVMGGYGFGNFIFGLISTALINPNNEEA